MGHHAVIGGQESTLRLGSIDEANCGAIPVTKSGQKRTMNSGASWTETMTMIARTSC